MLKWFDMQGGQKLKIGMPTLIELDTLKKNIELCNELQLDFVEINMNFPQYQLDRLNDSRLRELQLKHNLFFTLHL